MADRIYESQIEARAMPMPLNGPSAGSMIAEAAADLGKAALGYSLDRKQKDLASSAADRSVAFADMQARVQERIAQLKIDMPEGAPGFEAAAAKIVDEESSPFVESLGDPKLRNAFLPDVARFRASAQVDAFGYAIEARGDKTRADELRATSTLANNLGQAPTAENWDLYQKLTETRLAGYEGLLPHKAIDELRRSALATGAVSYAEGMDPRARKAMLESGQLDAILPAEKMLALKNGADVDIRTAESAARTQFNIARGEARDQVESVIRLARDGVPLPDADIEQASALASQYQLDGQAYNLRALGIQNRVNRETRAWTPQQFSTEINRLEQKIAAAGTKADPTDVLMRDQLATLRSTRVTQLNEHPDQFLASIGRTEQPIDWTDPDSFSPAALAARSRTRRALADATGAPLRLLNDNEAQPLIDAIHSESGSARLDAARKVALWGSYAPTVLNQVAANDDGFRVAARLGALPDGGRTLGDALTGREALKAAPNLLKVAVGEPNAGAVFASNAAYALRGISDNLRAGILETATNIYAARMARAGKGEWNENAFLGAVQSALGGMQINGRWTGGIAPYKGATVLLPVGMAPDDFSRRIARASPRDWGKAQNGKPVDARGRELWTGELRGLTPVSVGDGVYALWHRNTFVQRQGGGRYEVNVRLLPAGR